MKRFLYLAIALCALAACKQKPQEVEVLARDVPERSDDFIWENDYVVYRAYGKALENELVSPGFDVWVKNTNDLVADQRYKDELENGKTYHKDYGNGKDCYKVGKTLGGGASAPLFDTLLAYPSHNFASTEVLESKPDKAVFVLHYPEWEANGYKITLDKKITVEAGQRFCKAEDTYKFTGPADTLDIAAGIVRHDIEEELIFPDRVAIWEKASDTSVEPEDGFLGLAVVMPDADYVGLGDGHSMCIKTIHSGDPVTYYFSSVWSKFDIPTADDWFDLVEQF